MLFLCGYYTIKTEINQNSRPIRDGVSISFIKHDVVRQEIMADIERLECRSSRLSCYKVCESCSPMDNEKLNPVFLEQLVSCAVVEKPVVVHQHRERSSKPIQPFQNLLTVGKRRVGNDLTSSPRLKPGDSKVTNASRHLAMALQKLLLMDDVPPIYSAFTLQLEYAVPRDEYSAPPHGRGRGVHRRQDNPIHGCASL